MLGTGAGSAEFQRAVTAVNRTRAGHLPAGGGRSQETGDPIAARYVAVLPGQPMATLPTSPERIRMH